MTAEIDQCADNCLDYIFQITLKSIEDRNGNKNAAQKKVDFKISDTKVEKLLVQRGSTDDSFGFRQRGYSQLSDHFGLSATINLV